MVLEQEIDVIESANHESFTGWYRNSERYKHPHPKKMKVECSLDEDVINWLEKKSNEDEEFQIYINYYLRKIMNKELERNI